jgi:hypothetical protein
MRALFAVQLGTLAARNGMDRPRRCAVMDSDETSMQCVSNNIEPAKASNDRFSQQYLHMDESR